MNKWVIQLIVWIVTVISFALVGQCPPFVTIHPTGNASYVYGSHCHVLTNTSNEEFKTLLDWCEDLHTKGK